MLRYGLFAHKSRQEMDELGWDSCDIILVTGDAYVDHPQFWYGGHWGVFSEEGARRYFSQPDWNRIDDFKTPGRTDHFSGVTGGGFID